MVKKVGQKILEILEAKKLEEIEARTKTENIDLTKESRPYLPFKWNEQLKKWVGRDSNIMVKDSIRLFGKE